MDSQIEEVKNKLNVVDLVGSYVKLTKTGANLRGICPFHSEKKPSFFVSPARQMWHCFGCGAGSSIFDFVMKIEGIEFGDALRMLAQKAGVQLKRENVQLRTERQRLYEICDLACKFFEKQLDASAVGKEAKEYLLKRGITQESITTWRLGYSPDTWNGLSDFLIGQGYAREEIIKSGLAIEKENSSASLRASKTDSYDRFRGRIIFPVFDLNSQVVGFGGRVFKAANEKEVAKYINTPQTLLYDKSGVLYGLNNAKLAVRKQNGCVVVEGYTDVIMCHQAGYENTVAASGTALTARHLAILKRYSENLLLAFDMDVAGDSATKRGISLAQEQGFNIKIIESYVKDSDPADIILKDRALWQESLDKATSIMDYYFNSAFAGFDATVPEGKKEIANRILPAIKRLQNKIEQSYWIQKLSQKLDIKEEAVLEELARVKITPSQQAPPLAVVPPQNNVPVPIEGRKELIEKKIISLVLKNPEYIMLIAEPHYPFFSEKIASFLLKLKKLIQDQKKAALGEVEKDFKIIFDAMTLPGAKAEDEEFNYELKNFLAALALSAEIEYQEDGQEEMLLCLLQLKNIELKKKLGAISQEIKKAEQAGDSQKVIDLISRFNALTKEL
ncbi:MAG: DNA primase [Candidatus Staskawiczbacteria bacterium RIFCSPLOWO2_01_FULL_38_12b]|uniref:DNA primase n=1 Tax=Candidatus Staskawiczbacteria bacterium RIFCSPLOWO2_01_FULL_38_12b TaxID=1802214 RepID=A0A1G2IH01_9BACT|nr:MAG: DNA primase [Candidatus Staskawiczbacteria bacterium RIFCSPLOWO2_01_FULL_38_12b]